MLASSSKEVRNPSPANPFPPHWYGFIPYFGNAQSPEDRERIMFQLSGAKSFYEYTRWLQQNAAQIDRFLFENAKSRVLNYGTDTWTATMSPVSQQQIPKTPLLPPAP